MSFFGKLFGKASDKDPVSTGEAIQKLRETEEMPHTWWTLLRQKSE